MRLFETGLLFSLIILIIRLFLPLNIRSNQTLAFGLGGLITLLFIGHLLLEGQRWQMWPIYLLILLLLGPMLWIALTQPAAAVDATSSRSILAWIGLGLLCLITLVAAAPPLLFPIRALPQPSGPYATGTITVAHKDTARTEIFGETPGGPREFVSQIWYPAVHTPDGTLENLMPQVEITTRTLATRFGLPSFLLSHLRLITAYSQVEPPLAEPDSGQRFPVLIFSHGYNSSRSQSTTLMEELASHGYIVIAPTHTHGSAITVFPDGRIIFHDPDTLIGEGEILRQTGLRLGEQWTADLQFLLDYLESEAENRTGILFQKVDLERIGLFGHSTGGGVIFNLCHIDERCQAALGLDAWFGPVSDEAIDAGGSVPSYFLMSEVWPKPENAAVIGSFIDASGPQGSGWATIAGTNHYDFSDIPFLSPLTRQLGLSGTIDAYRVQEINRAFVRRFFDIHLKDETADPLTELRSQYSELSFGFPAKFQE